MNKRSKFNHIPTLNLYIESSNGEGGTHRLFKWKHYAIWIFHMKTLKPFFCLSKMEMYFMSLQTSNEVIKFSFGKWIRKTGALLSFFSQLQSVFILLS